MVYPVKLVFHIPTRKRQGGYLVAIDHEGFCQALSQVLRYAGVEGWYETPTFGWYKGNRYEQMIWTVFCTERQKVAALAAFRETFRVWNRELQQESFAYECDGELHIEQL